MTDFLGTVINPPQREVENRLGQAINKLESRASDIPGVSGASGAVVRDILPADDLDQGDDSNWTTARRWEQTNLTADSVDQVYQIDSNNNAEDKIVRVVGVANVADSPITDEIEFRDGTGATFLRANVETFDIVDISDVILFERDVTYGVAQDGAIAQYSSGGDDQVIYLGKVLEARGETVTPRNNDGPSARGGR